MSYFSELVEKSEKLSEKAQEYLDQFDFMSTDDMMQKIDHHCWRIFKECGEDYEKIPKHLEDAVTCVVDGAMPYYSSAVRPGSLKKSLGLSVVSVDAHLRNLLEQLEGRTDKELEFGIYAEC